MSESSAADQMLVDRIRQGEQEAWEELIARYEGRLLAFVDSRLRNRSASEDIVQEITIVDVPWKAISLRFAPTS